jgi:hypothetical protein
MHPEIAGFSGNFDEFIRQMEKNGKIVMFGDAGKFFVFLKVFDIYKIYVPLCLQNHCKIYVNNKEPTRFRQRKRNNKRIGFTGKSRRSPRDYGS